MTPRVEGRMGSGRTGAGGGSRREFLRGLAALMGLTGCAGPGGAASPRSLRVLSYNVHHGEGGDGRIDLERIAGVIRAANPDLVALQEVDRGARRTGDVDQGAEYLRRTGLHGWFGGAMPFQGGEYGQVLLSRWPLEAPRVLRLPGTTGREPRIAVVARVRVPGAGWVRWAGCHLDASRGDEDRWEQVAALDRVLGAGAEPLLLAGDFNDVPESRSMRRLAGEEGRWDDLAGAWAAPTIPAEAPRSRIDYVLGTPRGRWEAVASGVLPEAVASDHRPLWVDVRWRGGHF